MKIKLSPETRFRVRQFRERWLRPLQHASTGFVLALAALAVVATPFGFSTDRTVLRFLFYLRGTRPPPPEVVIVSIDSESYQKLDASPAYPLPRRFIAEALERILAARPKVLIFDEAGPKDPFMDIEADARIEAALRSGPTTIWNGVASADSTDSDARIPLSSEERFRRAAKMELPMTAFFSDQEAIYLVNPTVVDGPLEELAPLSRPLVELAHLEIERPSDRALINYYGPPGTFPKIPIHRLTGIGDPKASELVRGKVVLIGIHSLHVAKGNGDEDIFRVPVSREPMFGVEIHANTIGNLMQGNGLNRFSRDVELGILTVAVTVLGAFAVRQVSILTLGILTTCVALLLVAGYVAFARYHFWVANLGVFVMAYLLTLVACSLYLFWRAVTYRRYIDKTFGYERERGL